MLTAILSSLCVVAAPLPSSRISLVPTVLLKNAAEPGIKMPATGLGTGCAIGGCNWGAPKPFASLNMSKQWLSIGGRRFDGADSYGIEPGIGQAIKESKVPRSEVFIVSKTGPGGLAWPLGYNETISQAEQIVANYSTTYVDLLLIHWPVNYGEPLPFCSSLHVCCSLSLTYLLSACPCRRVSGPCSYHGPKPSIPTTDPLCDTALPSYSAKGCRLSTWRAMVSIWKRGLAKAIGVSNFNTSHLQEIADAGLPMPSVNQCAFSPNHGLHTKGCTPGSQTETCGDLLKYCQAHNIVYNGYSCVFVAVAVAVALVVASYTILPNPISGQFRTHCIQYARLNYSHGACRRLCRPYGGGHGAGRLLADPRLAKIAQAHGTEPAQVVLKWQWQLGIPVNPEAQKLQYQRENLEFFNFTLSTAEMTLLSNHW